MVKHVLANIGLTPKDLLFCSYWELKIITNILNNFGLSVFSLFTDRKSGNIKADNK